MILLSATGSKYFLILALPGKERQTREVAGRGREEGDCDENHDDPDYNNANNVHHDNENICSILLDVAVTVRAYKEFILSNLFDFCSRRYGDMD